jgi:hypothetical protein
MVMVLLFLGVVFLLVGFQSLNSDNNSADSASSTTTTSATSAAPATTSAASAAPSAKADVRVYNISEVAGAAQTVSNKLHDAQWNVVETDNLSVEGVTATTVYYGDTPGEKDAAEAVGKILSVPAEPRIPALSDKPPGVIVLVTG